MNGFKNLINAIEYIEKNICEKIDYAEAAKLAYCSLSRFQNIFVFITDITLSEYVRRRRMALSAKELINGGIKILDLAIKYGYESPEAFTRSFKAFHGASPMDVKKSGEYTDYSPISFKITITGGNYSMNTTNQITVCKNILIKYIDLPAIRFIGKNVMAEGKNKGEKYGEMWDKSHEFMPQLDAMTDYATVITDPCALMHNSNGDTKKNPMHYIVGKFMKAGTPVPDGFDFYDMPEAKVAYALFNGEFQEMIEKALMMTYEKANADGWVVPYPEGWFHAEVYINENIPKEGVVSRLGYLIAIKESSFNETIKMLGNAREAWDKLVNFIRLNYEMEENWHESSRDDEYRDQLKFKQDAKELASLYIRDGYVKVIMPFDKKDLDKFDEIKDEFSDTVREHVNTKPRTDKQYLWFHLHDTALTDDIINLFRIRKKVKL
ncbi:MAG: AraC family transcriptional regulator [Clostridiales bacterium]|jgi:AraC family transcriptional regulator|nr:AraC family transcriptional regulator [Clostridiales bacterium]